MKIDGATRLYGIIGRPVRHSLSPVMHNAAFEHLKENRAYLPFAVEDIEAALQGVRGLGIEGVSVTIPYKEKVLPFLDSIDPVAEKIGAVNTISCHRTSEGVFLHGTNTDWLGAVRPLEEKVDLQEVEAVILGAGGSAKAIGFGLLEAGARITICSRTEQRGRRLAEQLQCPWRSLDEAENLAGEILINATSVGMNEDVSPVAASLCKRFQLVMDIVYAPVKTRFLCDAEAGGCQTVSGIEMLLYQGVAQFELWTGLKAPVDVMRQALIRSL